MPQEEHDQRESSFADAATDTLNWTFWLVLELTVTLALGAHTLALAALPALFAGLVFAPDFPHWRIISWGVCGTLLVAGSVAILLTPLLVWKDSLN